MYGASDLTDLWLQVLLVIHLKFCLHHTCERNLPPDFLQHGVQGETLGTLRHGNGRLTCANGDVYTGQWCYGKREGAGHAVFDRRPSRDDAQPRPVCYNGQWKEDQTHG